MAIFQRPYTYTETNGKLHAAVNSQRFSCVNLASPQFVCRLSPDGATVYVNDGHTGFQITAAEITAGVLGQTTPDTLKDYLDAANAALL